MGTMRQDAAYNIAKLCNSGFMYDEGFMQSKQFTRYCTKMNDYATSFMRDAMGVGPNKPMDLSTIVASLFAFWMYDKNGNMLDSAQIFGNEEEADDAVRAADSDKEPYSGAYALWRNHLIPLAFCDPFDFADTDVAVRKGWRVTLCEKAVWDDFYEASFRNACLWYLNDAYSRSVPASAADVAMGGSGYDRITMSNFCVKAVAQDAGNIICFMKILLNMIWANVYSHVVWAQQERSDYEIAIGKGEEEIERLKEENGKLQDRVRHLEDEIIPEHKRKTDEVKADADKRVEARIREYEAKTGRELASERKARKKAEDEAKVLKAKLKALEEQIAIMDDIEADEDSYANAGGVEIDAASKIIFIASPAPNSKVQNTFDRIAQRFPNCKFVHDFHDLNADGDCYVLLTRYLAHHSEYNAAKDFLHVHGLPCIHSESQNADRIYDDITRKGRYRTGS